MRSTLAAGAAYGALSATGLISAALAAGPTAHPDPARRWVAGVSPIRFGCVMRRSCHPPLGDAAGGMITVP